MSHNNDEENKLSELDTWRMYYGNKPHDEQNGAIPHAPELPEIPLPPDIPRRPSAWLYDGSWIHRQIEMDLERQQGVLATKGFVILAIIITMFVCCPLMDWTITAIRGM